MDDFYCVVVRRDTQRRGAESRLSIRIGSVREKTTNEHNIRRISGNCSHKKQPSAYFLIGLVDECSNNIWANLSNERIVGFLVESRGKNHSFKAVVNLPCFFLSESGLRRLVADGRVRHEEKVRERRQRTAFIVD